MLKKSLFLAIVIDMVDLLRMAFDRSSDGSRIGESGNKLN